MIRRNVLSGVAVSVAVGLTTAGCLSGSAPTSREGETASEFDPDVKRMRRLGAAPDIRFEVSPASDYEYLEERNRVRLHYDSGDTSTMSFGRYGTHQAVQHGSDRLRRILDTNSLTGTGISTGQGRFELSDLTTSTTEESSLQEEIVRDAPIAPMVFHSHHYARDGSLISKPSVSFQEIVKAVPRLMDISITFPEQKYRAVLPVVCEKGWYKNE